MNDMAGTVQVAYLHPNTVSHSFSDSLMRLVAWDAAHDGRVVRCGGPLMFRCGAGGLVQARNDTVAHFLDKTEAEWLWCVDSDMGFDPDIIDRLVAVADPDRRPIVGALCFGLRETSPDGMQGWNTVPFPTIFGWGEKPDGEFGFACRADYPVNALTQVAGTGSACILIHRRVLEQMRDKFGDAWYEPVVYASGTRVSEDLSFCWRANLIEAPIFVHTGIRTTHHKQFWLSESDYWRSRTVPPASEPVAVIVPVMNRPDNAEPFMRSLVASTGLARVYAVCDADDDNTIDSWDDAGAAVIHYQSEDGKPGSFAQKANLGYVKTSEPSLSTNQGLFEADEPWLFLVGDDVSFHPGWLDYAQHVAATQNASVVGTNDLGNPRVMAGEHAVHMLIRRNYIDKHGGGWDGPGIVAHEGYRHWFVDDEIVCAARQRGEFAMAIGSIVEHMHPLFGKAASDATYRAGELHRNADQKLFRTRLADHG